MAGEINRRVNQAPRIRSSLPSRSGSKSYGPSLAVVAPVDKDGGVREQQKDLHKAIRSSKVIRRNGASAIRIADHRQLHATLIHPDSFSRTMDENDLSPTKKDLKKFAQLLHTTLRELRASREVEPVMVTGPVETYGEKGNTLVVEPYGWRGYRKPYADDCPNRLIADERMICVSSIEEYFGCDELEVGEVASTPHISLARKDGPINPHQLRGLAPIVRGVLLDTVGFAANYDIGVVTPGRRQSKIEPIEMPVPLAA